MAHLPHLQPGTWADWFSGTMSALAVVVAVSSYGFGEWRRKLADRERDIDTIRQVGFKLWRVVNGIHDIHAHVWVEREPLKDGGEELWKRISPLVGLERDAGLTMNASEISLLLRMKQSDFLSNLVLLTGRYDSIVSSMIEYSARYDALQAMLPPPPKPMTENVVSRMLTQREFLRIQPYSFQLESLLQNIRAMTKENVDMGEKLMAQLGPAAKSYFGKQIINVEIDQDRKKVAV